MRCPRSALAVAALAAYLLFSARAGFAFEVYTQPRQITGVEVPISSPDGRFELFYKRNDALEEMYQHHQIWLASKTRPAKTELLYSYGRYANVAWSPDSTMIAITDFEGSSNSHVLLFRISHPLAIETVSELDHFVETHSQEMLPSYDHFYVEVVGWSIDSGSLAIELRGDLTEWDSTWAEYTTHQILRQVKFRIP